MVRNGGDDLRTRPAATLRGMAREGTGDGRGREGEVGRERERTTVDPRAVAVG